VQWTETYAGCPMTVSVLQDFIPEAIPSQNIIWTWTRFSTLMEVWVFEM